MGESAGSSPQKCSPRFQPHHKAPAGLETASVKLEDVSQALKGRGKLTLSEANFSSQSCPGEAGPHAAPCALLGCHRHVLLWVWRGLETLLLHPRMGGGPQALSLQPIPASTRAQRPTVMQNTCKELRANTIFCQQAQWESQTSSSLPGKCMLISSLSLAPS